MSRSRVTDASSRARDVMAHGVRRTHRDTHLTVRSLELPERRVGRRLAVFGIALAARRREEGLWVRRHLGEGTPRRAARARDSRSVKEGVPGLGGVL
jgi:hypothetical protein